MNVTSNRIPNPLVFACLLGIAACASPREPAATASRIGVYDGRAVCIAYVNGPLFRQWMEPRRREHAAAKAAGDETRVREIESEMASTQERFHAQTFDGADVDDLLALVADKLPAVLRAAGVERLEKANRERDAGIVTVDVTDQLVELFSPDERARKWIADIRSKPFGR